MRDAVTVSRDGRCRCAAPDAGGRSGARPGRGYLRLVRRAALACLTLCAVACSAAPVPPTAVAPAAAPTTAPAHPPAVAPERRVSRIALGTLVEIVVRDPDPVRAQRAIEQGFAEVERLEALLSEWRPTSEISLLNASAGVGAVALSPETVDLLARAIAIAKDTGGAFDPTVLPLVRLWGFAGGEPRVPRDDEIAAALPLVGIGGLALDASAGTARLARRGAAIGLGAIGKGFVADRVAARLRAAGVPAAMIQAAGDFACYGGTSERPWPIGIEDPDRPGETIATFDLTSGGVSTSAPTYRFGEQDGVRFHHLIDPQTGRPARGARSVTIVAEEATLSDAYSTAVFVMGSAGAGFVAARPWLRGAIVLESGGRWASPGLEVRWLEP